MATSLGDGELKLRQRARRRLIGAIVLVVALIIVLPAVLERKPQPLGDKVQITFPEQTAADPSPPPAEPAAAERPAPAAEPGSAGPPDVQASAPEPEPPPQPAAAESTQPVANEPSAPAVAAESQTKRETFYVQVGVFAKSQNAKQVQTRLAKNNIKAQTELIRAQSGAKTRVRIGPFKTRSEADAMLARVKLAGEHDARIAEGKGG